MAKIGRKSAEDRVSPLIPGSAPPPAPSDLSPSEQEVWSGIVSSLPSDWITSSNSFLLRQLCRHVANGDLLAIDVARCREDLAEARQRVEDAADLKAKARERAQVASIERLLHRLLRALGSESDRSTRLATKLKLTLKSRYLRNDAAGAAAARPVLRPWEDWPGDRRQ